MASRAVILTVVTASVLASGIARAQPSSSDRALAQTLFDEGRSLTDAGRLQEACPKFRESQRLDPAGGTLLNLAVCDESAGKLASAWTEFHEALGLAVRDGRSDREAIARSHIDALTPRVPHVRFDTTKLAGVTDATISVDGEPVRSIAAPLPLDPGRHHFVVTAPGTRPRSFEIEIAANGATVDVEAGPLERIMSPAPRDGSVQRTWGLVLGGVGIAALGTGAVFGLSALSKHDESNTRCPSSQCTDSRGVTLEDEAITQSWIASAAIGVGVAALVTGGILFFTAPAKQNAARFRGATLLW